MRSSLAALRRALLTARQQVTIPRSIPPAVTASISTSSNSTPLAATRIHRPFHQPIPSHRQRFSTTPHRTATSEPQSKPQKLNRAECVYDVFPQTLPNGPPPYSPFHIDLRALKREFLKLQSRAHPDLAPASEKRAAQAQSARINEAYKILSSPLLRAQYLLHMYEGEDAGPLGEGEKTEDPELLMEVMETHHEVESAGSEDELEDIRLLNEGRIKESVKKIEGFFGPRVWGIGSEVGGIPNKSPEEEKGGMDLQGVRGEVVKLKYWDTIRNTIHEWEVRTGHEVHEKPED